MIDWPHVQQLCNEVGVDDFDEILELLFEEASEIIAKLETLTDRSCLAQDMHFLKGSALSIGFSHLSQLCHEGENAARNGDAESVDIATILQCYAKTKQAFLDNSQRELGARPYISI